MLEFLFILIGVLIGMIIVYIALSPRLKATIRLDKDTQSKNDEIRAEQLELIKQYTSLKEKKEQILANIAEFQKQAKQSADSLYQKSLELANEKMDIAITRLSDDYQKAKDDAENDYLQTLKDCTISFQQQINSKQLELNKIQEKLTDLSYKAGVAVEANKRAEEMKTKKDFYRLNLTQIDIDEIAKLREVTPYLRDSEPLNKVIWKVYYEKAYTDLIGRMIGSGVHTGIYKITNIENQMCYVGQAVNIGR